MQLISRLSKIVQWEDPLIQFCIRHGSSSTLHQILDASLNTRNLTLIVAEIVCIYTLA